MSAAPAQHARYRWIDPADLVHLSPKDLAAYRADRRRFDAEVAEHVAHIRVHGWLDVGRQGREVRFYVGRALVAGAR